MKKFLQSHSTIQYKLSFSGALRDVEEENSPLIYEYQVILKRWTENNNSGKEIIFFIYTNKIKLHFWHENLTSYDERFNPDNNINVLNWIHKLHFVESNDPIIQEIYSGYKVKTFIVLLSRYFNITDKDLSKLLGFI